MLEKIKRVQENEEQLKIDEEIKMKKLEEIDKEVEREEPYLQIVQLTIEEYKGIGEQLLDIGEEEFEAFIKILSTKP